MVSPETTPAVRGHCAASTMSSTAPTRYAGIPSAVPEKNASRSDSGTPSEVPESTMPGEVAVTGSSDAP
ncbi:hypothetical protein [Gordonia oryzae]|uniref:hypothetical protein n=1 Tax=Gordonia oryzae TaxID=2487349 RepID=UPI00162295E6|nr:hypothetical protein [Gordonia oryzae]